MEKPFGAFYGKNPKLKKILKRVSAYELYRIETDTYAHQACKIIAENKDVIMLHVLWNFFDMIPLLENEKGIRRLYETMMCGCYDDKMKYREDPLHVILSEYMREGKVINVILNIVNYELDELETGNEYGHHSTSLIFYPLPEGNYNCFYINSHGEAMLTTNKFDVRITRRRFKRLSFNEPIDILCIKKYLSFLRKRINKYGIQIFYDHTKNHNYYGANLQCADDHGVCFAFPLIIWYYLTNFYNKERYLEYKKTQTRIPSMSQLLKTKSLIILVHSCFLILNKKFEEETIKDMNRKKGYNLRNSNAYCLSPEENTYKQVHHYTQLSYEEITLSRRIEVVIEKSGVHFVKKVAACIVSLLSDPFVFNIIYC